uniref:Polynucleotide 5'-hydroxyl-kinase NOL9 (inferred by orthology to a human protein) n=1 Tax=Strongyloides venezuelensis TaxID=75913 RepID=A0A0K0F333_STRVS
MGSVEIFNLANDTEVIMVFHQSGVERKNEYIYFGGICEVAVLHGRIDVQGYPIDTTNSTVLKPILVSSFRKMKEQITITNITTGSENGLPMDDGRLRKLFPDDGDIFDKVYASVRRNSAILYLKRNEPSLLMQLIAMYPNYLKLTPSTIETRIFTHAAVLRKGCCSRDDCQLTNSYKNKVKEVIQKLSSTKKSTIKILGCGPNENGVLASCKYLVNTCLSIRNCQVYWADLNVESPEFTPPGVVSLTHVKGPILVDSYLHSNADVIHALYYGKSRVEGEDQRYVTMVSSVFQEFGKITRKEPEMSYLLVMNSPPLRGMKKRDLITTLVGITSPDDIIICCKGKPTRYMPMNFDGNRAVVVEPPMSDGNDNEFTDNEAEKSEKRRILFSAYFSKFVHGIQNYYFTTNLSKWPSNQIDFSRVKLHVLDKSKTFEEDTFDDALDIVLVALCRKTDVNNGGFSEHNLKEGTSLCLLDSNYKGTFRRVNYRKTNLLFIGYGIITNVDQVNEKFDICTTISKEKLVMVNVITKSSAFSIPSEILRLRSDFSYSKCSNDDIKWKAWNKNTSRFVDTNDKSDFRNCTDNEYKRIRES